jgi:hypothetical protein
VAPQKTALFEMMAVAQLFNNLLNLKVRCHEHNIPSFDGISSHLLPPDSIIVIVGVKCSYLKLKAGSFPVAFVGINVILHFFWKRRLFQTYIHVTLSVKQQLISYL